MSAPKPQVEKVSFSYWLVDLCLSVFVSLSFLSQEEFKIFIILKVEYLNTLQSRNMYSLGIYFRGILAQVYQKAQT